MYLVVLFPRQLDKTLSRAPSRVPTRLGLARDVDGTSVRRGDVGLASLGNGNLTFSSRPGPSQSVLVAGGRRRPSHRQHPSEPGNEAFFSCPSSSSRKLAVHYSTVDSSCPSQSPRIFPVGADFCDTVLGNFYGFFSTIIFFPLS